MHHVQSARHAEWHPPTVPPASPRPVAIFSCASLYFGRYFCARQTWGGVRRKQTPAARPKGPHRHQVCSERERSRGFNVNVTGRRSSGTLSISDGRRQEERPGWDKIHPAAGTSGRDAFCSRTHIVRCVAHSNVSVSQSDCANSCRSYHGSKYTFCDQSYGDACGGPIVTILVGVLAEGPRPVWSLLCSR